MQLTDALLITVLGMAVVFSGLLLTAGLIVAFGRIQGLVEATHGRRDSAAIAAQAPSDVAAVAETGPPVDPEVLTVIATILEVEHRLQRVADRSRTTT